MTGPGLRGLALIDAAIAHIEAHPETWKQDRYRCASGMCVAGWMAELAGGEWLYPADGRGRDCLAPVPDDPAENVYADDLGCAVVGVDDRARHLAGLSQDQAGDLFAGGNTLTDIRRIRDEIAGRAT